MTTLTAVGKRLLRFFLSGTLAILPIVVTIAVVYWVADYVAHYIGPDTQVGGLFSSIVGEQHTQSNALSYVIGWLVVLAVIFLFGVVIEMGAKKYFQFITSFFFRKIPIVGGLFETSQKFVELFEKSDDNAMKGMSAVYCFFGKQGPAVLAFLASPKIFHIDGQDYQIVVIPTAPIPFGGGMLLIPVEQIQPANMSVDGLMSTYISMGVTAAQFINVKEEPDNSSSAAKPVSEEAEEE